MNCKNESISLIMIKDLLKSRDTDYQVIVNLLKFFDDDLNGFIFTKYVKLVFNLILHKKERKKLNTGIFR